MNIEQFSLKLANFEPNSRVWIYQANRFLTEQEIDKMKPELDAFTSTWSHHGMALKAKYGILYNLFIVFVVDQTQAEVGGCGIDKSVTLIKKFNQDFDMNFFDRFDVAFFHNNKIQCMNKDSFLNHIKTHAEWSEESLVFNNSINTLSELKSKWIMPFNQSWHHDFFLTSNSFNLSL